MKVLSSPIAGPNVTFPGGGGAAGGNPGEIQYNSIGSLAGAGQVEVDADGDLVLISGVGSSNPIPGAIKLSSARIGADAYGQSAPMVATLRQPGGIVTPLQSAQWAKQIGFWVPPGNAATLPGVAGMYAPTALGTATARSVALTNPLTRAKRLGYVSSTTAGTFAGHFSPVAQYAVGSGTMGGFFYVCDFAISDAVIQTVARSFVGLSSSVATPTNVSPATLTNCIGIGHEASGTTWKIYYGGTSPNTPYDLGISVNTTSRIKLLLWSLPGMNPGVINFQVVATLSDGTTSISTGVMNTFGEVGATFLASTVLLAHRAWRTNNTAAVAIGLDIIQVYIETEL